VVKGEAGRCWAVRAAGRGSVEGAPDPQQSTVQDMGVDHGGGHVAVAEELLMARMS
jgi:hypothetical protein